jgi:hypothetical protein
VTYNYKLLDNQNWWYNEDVIIRSSLNDNKEVLFNLRSKFHRTCFTNLIILSMLFGMYKIFSFKIPYM